MDTKKAVAYLRVSTGMQVEGYSLDAQLSSIERYAKAYDIEIIDTYKDEGRSGKSVEGREDFIRMLNDIETDAITVDYVMVFKLSRFGRNSADVLTSLQRLQEHNTNLICTEDRLDSSTGSGKLMITVLSAVAEIERVNIIEQTMAGRRQKAEEGKWNGGFPPYGYSINEDDILIIEEKEAKAVRIIYDKYIGGMGFDSIAKYLNRQNIPKVPRENGTLTQWSSKLVRDIIDNEVYKGYIAYGRRTKVKVKGTANKYRTVKQDPGNYILAKGLHEAIIPEDVWQEAHELRIETGVASPSSIGRDRIHVLSGILRCPECGGPMYTNKNSWTRQDGTEVERHYYVCSRAFQARGKECKYKSSLRKDIIEPDVIKAMRDLVKDPLFAEEVKAKIGKEVDTTEIDKEIENYKKSLRQYKKAIEALEYEIDTMPDEEPNRDIKVEKRRIRLRRLEDDEIDVNNQIDDLLRKREAIETNALNLEEVYKVLENFDLLFDQMSDEDKRKTISYLIKEVEVFKKPQGKTLSRLKSITFNFPVVYKGSEGNKLLWDNETHVESIIMMTYCGDKEKK